MKHCVVIGGGISGLTAAAYLSDSGFKVTLLEASPKLGGRTYSFKSPSKNIWLDNGQHILLGCYKHTIDFLSLIGAKKNFYFQKRLEVNLIDREFGHIKLEAVNLPYPLDIFFGFLKLKNLSFMDKISVVKLLLKLRLINSDKLKELSVKEWFKRESQSDKVVKTFWEVLAIGAMNTSTEKASAKIFVDILKQIFLTGHTSSSIVLPKRSLTESLINDAEEFLKWNECEIFLPERVEKLVVENQKINLIKTSKKEIKDFDFVISALPAYALDKIITLKESGNFSKLKYSSILNVHLWVDKINQKKSFYGLIGSPVHWIFKKKDHLNVVISNADELIRLNDEDLLALIFNELEKYSVLKREEIKDHLIIKEKRATFVPDNYSLNLRPSPETEYNNFFLAGDWTDTGLPSTIESAVKSGKSAADLLINLQ